MPEIGLRIRLVVVMGDERRLGTHKNTPGIVEPRTKIEGQYGNAELAC